VAAEGLRRPRDVEVVPEELLRRDDARELAVRTTAAKLDGERKAANSIACR
jgi:hypothetical protein